MIVLTDACQAGYTGTNGPDHSFAEWHTVCLQEQSNSASAETTAIGMASY